MDDVVSFQKRERSLTSDQRASVLKLNGLTISIGDTSLLMSPRILMGPVDLTLVYQYLKKLNRLHDDTRTEVSRDLPHFRAREKELSVMAPAMHPTQDAKQAVIKERIREMQKTNPGFSFQQCWGILRKKEPYLFEDEDSDSRATHPLVCSRWPARCGRPCPCRSWSS